MRFRLIDLFKWVTIIGVGLPFVIWFFTKLTRCDNPRQVLGFLTGCTLLVAVACLGAIYFGTDKHDQWTVRGMGVGIAAGIFIGANTDLGLWAINTFNPTLPPQDFQFSFGVIVGSIGGAFCGTLIGGIAGIIRRRCR